MMNGANDQFEMRVTAEASRVGDLRCAVVAFAREAGFDDTNAIALAVSEAITNVVVHAYRDCEVGDLRVVACDKPDRLVVVVRDYGSGMLPRADSPGLGLGLPLISTMADDLQIEAADGSGTLLRMHFMKTAAEQAA
jgi:anti-sigma regulatory factor (Ser/Thr protein kinase)